MTHLRFPLLALCFALVLALPAQAQDKASKKSMKADADIVQTAMNADNFETLVTALKAADLVEALQGEGPFTVFAPTDAAFAELPDGTLTDLLKPENKAKLQSILKYHVVSGAVMAKDVIELDEAKTLQGAKLGIRTSDDGTVMLQGKSVASVSKTDITASNGVIHVIDAVLMPPAQTAQMEEMEDQMGEDQ